MTTFLSSDPTMYKAYMEGKDLYAMIAQSAFDNNYEDNLEFWPEGTELELDGQKVIAGHKTHLNPDGKERRSVGKVLNLAATYGMGGATAGATLGKSREEGERLLENFFKGFGGVKVAIEQSKDFLRKNEYVEDFIGRRRRLTDINLPKYTVELKAKSGEDTNFNPFLICKNREIKDPKIIKWENRINDEIKKFQSFIQKKAEESGKPFEPTGEMSSKAFDKIQKEAYADGIIISANTGKIAQAERQCFNARIQGSAASLTKIAMIDIANDPQLKEWGAELIITVHDEVLVECPEKYADLVEKRLPEIMVNAAKKVGDDVPQSCDPYNVSRWYCDSAAAAILKEYKKVEKENDRDTAINFVVKNHTEIPRDAIVKTIETGCDLEF